MLNGTETVRRLFRKTRPKGDYERSLRVIGMAREIDPGMTTKSGVMVGLGEGEDDVLSLMDDLRRPDADCRIMTIGQYLQPRKKGISVSEYIHPDTFARYRSAGEDKGFAHVFAGPFVRSSYNAREAMLAAKGDVDGDAGGDPEGRSFMTGDMSGQNIAVGGAGLPMYT